MNKEVLKLFLTVCSANNWSAKSMDGTAAFLQSCGMEREVFLKPPKEANCDNNILWKLKKMCLWPK